MRAGADQLHSLSVRGNIASPQRERNGHEIHNRGVACGCLYQRITGCAATLLPAFASASGLLYAAA